MNDGQRQSPRRVDASWPGHLEIGQGWARWQGVIGPSEAHRHIAAQRVQAMGPAPVTVHGINGRIIQALDIAIDPLVPHRIAPGAAAVLVFVEPWAHRCGLHIPASVVGRLGRAGAPRDR